VVIEEHAPQGGLAPRTKQIAWDTRATCRLDTFTLQDAFIHNYGSHDDLLSAHGIDLPSMSAGVGLA
jgi:transketolase